MSSWAMQSRLLSSFLGLLGFAICSCAALKVQTLGLLSQEQLRHCSFEVVMFDTRNLTDIPHFGDMLIPDEYWSLTAVLNYAYAKQFGYRFSFIHLDQKNMLPDYNVAWHRVFYFNERLQKSKGANECSWLLYLDTDAFVHNFTEPMDTFLSNMASTYNIVSDVGAIFAQEQVNPPEMPATLHAVNAGVYLVQSNDKSRFLFDTWSKAAASDLELKKTWPAEQGVLTELRFPGKYYTRLGKNHARLHEHPDISGAMALINMTEMNSPWGRYVEHVWSGPGSEKRGTDYTAMLDQIHAAVPSRFDKLLEEVREHIVAWEPVQPTAA